MREQKSGSPSGACGLRQGSRCDDVTFGTDMHVFKVGKSRRVPGEVVAQATRASCGAKVPWSLVARESLGGRRLVRLLWLCECLWKPKGPIGTEVVRKGVGALKRCSP